MFGHSFTTISLITACRRQESFGAGGNYQKSHREWGPSSFLLRLHVGRPQPEEWCLFKYFPFSRACEQDLNFSEHSRYYSDKPVVLMLWPIINNCCLSYCPQMSDSVHVATWEETNTARGGLKRLSSPWFTRKDDMENNHTWRLK